MPLADMNPIDTSRLTSDAKRLPRGIEGGDIRAKENDSIAVDGTCQGHLDAIGSMGSSCNFDPVNSACSTQTSGSTTQGIDAPLAVGTDGVGSVISNDNCCCNALDLSINDSDRKRSAPIIVKWPCSSCHKSTSCGVKPIDWSELENRQVNDNYDRGAA